MRNRGHLALVGQNEAPESPCSVCRSYGHFTHNHPPGYVNPMYDALGPPARSQDPIIALVDDHLTRLEKKLKKMGR